MAYFHALSYVLSRFAFLATHLVFVYWLVFLLNDPFHFGTNTLDYPPSLIKPAESCTPLIKENVTHDLGLFALWWGTHSILARKVVKQALGLWEQPFERPLFAAIASLMWGVNVFLWRPISDCERWDPLTVPLSRWGIHGTIITLATLLVVGFLWVLPDHVFGTAKYQYPRGKFPHSGILAGFPYGLVRHPAATGFLWAYWALPAYTRNHIWLASLWTVFIVVGTLVFEEGGLKGVDEFGKKYAAYRNATGAFCPYPSSVRAVLTGKPKSQAKAA
eukprot:TRINITY_DN219_c0_g1_i1.p1 TRINITY_DN219_c0_g1~~TRINITY_DN219_c0_g1_i1.p1  ORF type:complete len:275 (+),score=34.97 TRINITY_DN219_c0_g1_i1:114-938(+)